MSKLERIRIFFRKINNLVNRAKTWFSNLISKKKPNDTEKDKPNNTQNKEEQDIQQAEITHTHNDIAEQDKEAVKGTAAEQKQKADSGMSSEADNVPYNQQNTEEVHGQDNKASNSNNDELDIVDGADISPPTTTQDITTTTGRDKEISTSIATTDSSYPSEKMVVVGDSSTTYRADTITSSDILIDSDIHDKASTSFEQDNTVDNHTQNQPGDETTEQIAKQSQKANLGYSSGSEEEVNQNSCKENSESETQNQSTKTSNTYQPRASSKAPLQLRNSTPIRKTTTTIDNFPIIYYIINTNLFKPHSVITLVVKLAHQYIEDYIRYLRKNFFKSSTHQITQLCTLIQNTNQSLLDNKTNDTTTLVKNIIKEVHPCIIDITNKNIKNIDPQTLDKEKKAQLELNKIYSKIITNIEHLIDKESDATTLVKGIIKEVCSGAKNIINNLEIQNIDPEATKKKQQSVKTFYKQCSKMIDEITPLCNKEDNIATILHAIIETGFPSLKQVIQTIIKNYGIIINAAFSIFLKDKLEEVLTIGEHISYTCVSYGNYMTDPTEENHQKCQGDIIQCLKDINDFNLGVITKPVISAAVSKGVYSFLKECNKPLSIDDDFLQRLSKGNFSYNTRLRTLSVHLSSIINGCSRSETMSLPYLKNQVEGHIKADDSNSKALLNIKEELDKLENNCREVDGYSGLSKYTEEEVNEAISAIKTHLPQYQEINIKQLQVKCTNAQSAIQKIEQCINKNCNNILTKKKLHLAAIDNNTIGVMHDAIPKKGFKKAQDAKPFKYTEGNCIDVMKLFLIMNGAVQTAYLDQHYQNAQEQKKTNTHVEEAQLTNLSLELIRA